MDQEIPEVPREVVVLEMPRKRHLTHWEIKDARCERRGKNIEFFSPLAFNEPEKAWQRIPYLFLAFLSGKR
jgi:hypothetical protein